MDNPKIKICILDFWPGAFEGDFFDYFLQRASNSSHTFVSIEEEPDVFITSVFGNSPSPREKTIFITGENVRPNFYKHRFSLSFDKNEWGGGNFYLPLWKSYLKWDGYSERMPNQKSDPSHSNESLMDITKLTNTRTLGNIKTKFCALVASNPEATRTNLFLALNGIAKVDGYGKMFGQILKQSKFEILKDYKFCLCPENDYYPGYVTEKLFQAWYAGTVPIYMGSIPASEPINNKAFIHFNPENNIEELVSQVTSINESREKYLSIYEQPILTKEPSINEAILFLRSAIIQTSGKQIRHEVHR